MYLHPILLRSLPCIVGMFVFFFSVLLGGIAAASVTADPFGGLPSTNVPPESATADPYGGLPGVEPPSASNPPGASASNPPGASASNPPSSGSGLMNPLKFTTIEGFLVAVLEIIIIFAIPIILFFIIYAGFLFVTAQGEPAKLTQAKAALLWAVVGGVIIIGASALVKVIQATVNSFR